MSSSAIDVMEEDGGVAITDDQNSHNVIAEHSFSQSSTSKKAHELLSEFPDEQDEPASPMMNLGGLEPPPGQIIFSPQDAGCAKPFVIMRPKLKYRGSGKVRVVPKDTLHLENIILKEETKDEFSMTVSCKICGKEMLSGKTLVQHMATHAEEKAFQCPYCPKSFSRKVHLQGHVTLHGERKQFECPLCFQKFSRQDCVKIHMRIHDKSQCFFCPVCQKAFLTGGALNIHLRIHRGEKPFKCHICEKCFTQKNHLITHIKRHSKVDEEIFTKKLGPRIFQCEHCSRSFIRLSDYERHVQWNHGTIADRTTWKADASILEKEPSSLFSRYGFQAKRGMKRSRIMLCTTATQTDEEGGHIIIPRKYRSNLMSSGTQVSAPGTPKPDEENYEDEIFDEGMDRNYSSDEEMPDDIDDSQSTNDVSDMEKPWLQITESTSNAAQDAAFDAMLGKAPPPSENKETCESNLQNLNNNVENVNKSQSTLNQEKPQDSNSKDKAPADSSKNAQDCVANKGSHDHNHSKKNPIPSKPTDFRVRRRSYKELEEIRESRLGKNLRYVLMYGLRKTKSERQSRGRGMWRRGIRKGGSIKPALYGATELRLIRRSMQSFIEESQATDELKKETQSGSEVSEIVDDPCEISKPTEEAHIGKRQAKKEHSKDFVCNIKGCVTCRPIKTEVIKEPEPQPAETIDITESEESIKEEKPKFINYLSKVGEDLLSQIQILDHDISDYDDEDYDDNYDDIDSDTSMIIPDRTTSIPYFTKNTSGNIFSPPVELKSFCIPTYSCKLCGREFRFEGKLHRHIEAVHQNKSIFSPDVKPGRAPKPAFLSGSLKPGRGPSRSLPPRFPKYISRPHKYVDNPEIAALRSEWDDELVEGDEDESGGIKETTSRDIKPSRHNDGDYANIMVNMNKLGGTAATSFKSSVGSSSKTVINNNLETKCKKLLSKLFDSSLLTSCGFYEDHISAVLGRILQQYGVKMIEDYGQGQYEVLKYNLWRLIEWKVTAEQMEEFYSQGKSVEEMMDDIMGDRVPVLRHDAVVSQSTVVSTSDTEPQHIASVDDGQVVLTQVAGVLGTQLNLPEGVTQVVLTQDISPEFLRGAQIVTIDPTTGQVISQVTADQVILTDALGENFGQQIANIGDQVITEVAVSGTVAMPIASSSTGDHMDSRSEMENIENS